MMLERTANKKNKGNVTKHKGLQLPPPKPVIEGIAIDDLDILLDGESHLEKISEILRKSRHRVIIHTTFHSLEGSRAYKNVFL